MSQLRRELRRSTRVPLKVVISAQSLTERLICDAETVVVNRHGALISCTVPLRLGSKIEIHVIITDKRGAHYFRHLAHARRFQWSRKTLPEPVAIAVRSGFPQHAHHAPPRPRFAPRELGSTHFAAIAIPKNEYLT